MFKPLPLFIGLRFAKSLQRSVMARFITLASTIGITLGVMVLIVGLSAMNGFERELLYRVLGVIPSAEITSDEGVIPGVSKKISTLTTHESVVAAAPEINVNGLLSHAGIYKAVQVRSIDPTLEQKVLNLKPFVVKGSLDDLNSNVDNTLPKIVIGEQVAKHIKADIGDSIELLMTRPSKEGGISVPLATEYQISGIIKIGGQLDSLIAFAGIENTRKLLEMKEDTATVISFKTRDIFKAREQSYSAVRYLVSKIPESLYVQSWVSKQGKLYNDIQMIRSILYLALVLVVAVACFNIISSMIMSVNEKRSEIAILMSMGYRKSQLIATFVVHGGVSGLVGSVFGIILGILTSLYLTEIISFIETLFGFHLLNQDVYFIDFVPSELHWFDVFIVGFVAVLLSLLAATIPAWFASRIKPAIELSGK